MLQVKITDFLQVDKCCFKELRVLSKMYTSLQKLWLSICLKVKSSNSSKNYPLLKIVGQLLPGDSLQELNGHCTFNGQTYFRHLYPTRWCFVQWWFEA